jgi:hypothetical protein
MSFNLLHNSNAENAMGSRYFLKISSNPALLSSARASEKNFLQKQAQERPRGCNNSSHDGEAKDLLPPSHM